MGSILAGTLAVVLTGLAASCGLGKLSDRQLRDAERACLCRCVRVSEADWPFRWSYPGLLKPSETVSGAWGGGALVCMPGEDEPGPRAAVLEDTVEAVNRRRALERAE